MMVSIDEARAFTTAHLRLMMETKDLLEKFSLNKDAYMVENSKFVCEYLTVYEQHNLQGYNNGGYAYRNSNFSSQLQKAEVAVVLPDQASLIDRVTESFKKRDTIVDAQLAAKSMADQDIPFMKQEASKVLSKFKNPFKQLYMWGAQEVLDLRAMQECF